jgi:hypothetical protein
MAKVTRLHGRRTDDEVEDLLMRIRGLVFVRAILEERGASAAELDEHQREIERLRRRLAHSVADGSSRLDAA